MTQEKDLKTGEVIKVRYILLIFIAVYFNWDMVWHWVGENYTNFEYLADGCIALTAVAISKTLIKKEGRNFQTLMGPLPKKADYADILYVLFLLVSSSIGIWGTLIWCGAQIDLPWTLDKFSLVDWHTFSRVVWLKNWLIASILAAGVLGPVTEELVLRGFILRRLRQKYSALAALVISALIFSVLHFNVYIVSSFIHGLLYGLLAFKYSSLYIPMIVHGAYNFTVDALSYYFGVFRVVEPSQIAAFDYWLLEFILAVCSVTLIILYIRQYLPVDRTNHAKPLYGPVTVNVDGKLAQVWRD